MRCLALFSGGLDAQIAVRMMQRQSIDVIGIYVQTPFTPPAEVATTAANRLGIDLQVVDWTTDYVKLLERPLFGFAQEMAPCLDCRIGMLQRVQALMPTLDASFVISGEVIGQRPSSLRSRDLETIAIHGGVDDLLLRPLSAQLLPPTLPERNGWVDRSLLHAWQGRGRREQLQIGSEWQLTSDRDNSTGCLLLEPTYASRLRKLLQQRPQPTAWQLKSLRVGRHFGLNTTAHLVVARNSDEGSELTTLFDSAESGQAVLLQPTFRGPLALLTGTIDEHSLSVAASLVAQFGKEVIPGESTIRLLGTTNDQMVVPPLDHSQLATSWK
ncbi:hypothetical protein NA78x_002706 [Anatilimnocola sp. NA78]|uniref:hypothetical protein n=1 Tax=Anatilimnocola sp. NA78 TaxID=3415683 RepID=UPI003CE56572